MQTEPLKLSNDLGQRLAVGLIEVSYSKSVLAQLPNTSSLTEYHRMAKIFNRIVCKHNIIK